jgi:hypothetical protein
MKQRLKYLHIIGVSMPKKQTQKVDTTQVDTNQVDTNQINLQLTDLIIAVQAIQLASSRGAFKPEEFTDVGGCYERIVAFLSASGAVSTAPAEQPQGN